MKGWQYALAALGLGAGGLLIYHLASSPRSQPVAPVATPPPSPSSGIAGVLSKVDPNMVVKTVGNVAELAVGIIGAIGENA